MAVDPRVPCVIGVAQRTWHLGGEHQAPEPLEMQAEVAAAAIADAEASGDLTAAVDRLGLVHCMSWPYDDPTGRLASAVGITPSTSTYSSMSGTVGQQLVGAAADRITSGESEVELVVGAEALDTKRRLKKAGERPSWSHRNPDPPGIPFDTPFHEAEIAHEVFQAWLTFAVRDIARRARIGTSPEEHRQHLGELLAPLSEIAVANPYAWFPAAHTPTELITATTQNRMVGYPYTKTMVAVMDVDMAASVVVASWEAADRLGVPEERRVPLRGWAFGCDAAYVAEHPDLSRSPAMGAVSSEALRVAGVGIDDIAEFDLYSCFASSVDFALDALGLLPGDARPFSVTGGLPYCGGPASNYMTHAIATMVGRLRDQPGSLGMVSGVGMHMTKHVFAVYGGDPHTAGDPRPADLQPELDTANTSRRITDNFDGDATLAAYSIVHGRDGDAKWGLGIVDLDDGTRAYARAEDGALLAEWERRECVGDTITLRSDGAVNRVVV
ncbi:MAG: acetyl-CoA synthetase [Microthrixaceae bacterium]